MALHRFKMYRGKRPADDPLPAGRRLDTRRHTRHCLRPPPELVDAFLDAPSDAAWARFSRAYLAVLRERYADDPTPFRTLAERAMSAEVYIGCSCPTARNPDPAHCHTMLALQFMAAQFPELDVVWP